MLDASKVVPGSPLAPDATLPVSISNFVPVSNDLSGGVFITAATPGANEFSLTGYNIVLQKFIPFAEQTVSLNGTNGPNPLYNAGIDFVAFMSNVLTGFFIVPNKNSSQIFFRSGAGVLLSRNSIPDALGNTASGVVAMEGSNLGVTYVAVTPMGSSNFGDPGSGVNVVNAFNGAIQTTDKAAPLDNTSVAFTLGTDPVTITNAVSLSWSVPLTMIFAGAGQIVGGAAVTDKVSLVARGVRNEAQKADVQFSSILNPAFDLTTLVPDTNYILLEEGASATGIVFRMEMMEASTRQPLLIMVGRMLNSGEIADQVKNQVYALPLTLAFNPEIKAEIVLQSQSGFLAKKGGNLGDSALTAADLYQPTDLAVQVGQGPLPTDVIINQLVVNGDVVYAITNDVVPGVYSSRALFNTNGVVIAWTPWMRSVATPSNTVFAAALNTLTGIWFTLTTQSVQADTVVQTLWNKGDALQGAAAAIMQLTGSTSMQSITALSGYDYRTAGMGNIAALVCVDRNQVILTQTGVGIAGTNLFYSTLPDSAYTVLVTADDTTLTTPVTNEPVVLIKGGIFDTIDPLTTATIIHSASAQDTWLCVGGNGGVTIWATDSGAGWGFAFGNDLSALPVGLKMHRLGNYTDVRTLYADAPYLYVATPYHIDRIDLTNGITVTGDTATAPTTMVAQVGVNLSGTGQNFVITDLLFAQELGLVATTVGLYRTQSGTSALDANPQWELFILPESEFPIETLTGFGLNGLPTTLAEGGDLWVLSGTARSNRSIINRVAVNAFGATITDTTLVPFMADWFVKNKQGNVIPSFFLDFGQYKDVVASDGAEYLFGRSVEAFEPATITTPNILQMIMQPRSLNRFVGVRAVTLFPIPPIPLSAQSDIITMMQEPATGAWYIATNFGLIVQG